VEVEVGSVLKHAEDRYYSSLNGKFAKFELLDTNGTPVPFKGDTTASAGDSESRWA